MALRGFKFNVTPATVIIVLLMASVVFLILQRPEVPDQLLYLHRTPALPSEPLSPAYTPPANPDANPPAKVAQVSLPNGNTSMAGDTRSDGQRGQLRGVPDWLLAKARRVINPYKGCQELYPGVDVLNPYTGVFLQEMVAHNVSYWTNLDVRRYFKAKKKEPDGYTLKCCPAQVNLMLDLARIPWVKTICEVGFNAGHSAVTWLAAKPGTKLYAFDLGYHGYTQPLADYLMSRFPGRMEIILGDSGVTLPRFIKKRPEVKCDILSIDGGHFYKYAIKDFNNFRKMASLLNILIFDDYPMGDHTLRDQDLGRVWEEKRENGQLTEIFRCNFLQDKVYKLGAKGFTVGQINL